jgi:hypothetical protein
VTDTAVPGWSTEFETGLLDDFDFTVVRSFFAPDAKYNDGNTLLLQWEGKTDNDDVPETHAWFPLGKGWVSRDGGKTITHESGKAGKYFVKTSIMARLIARCVEDFGIGDLLSERGNPFTSKVWEGMRFHMKNEVIDFGSGMEAKTKLFPVRFLGVVGAAAQAGNGSSSAADKIAAAKAKAAAKASNGNGLRDQVVAVFNKHNDFAAAQEEALQIDGVTDDPILDEILDESGLWASVKG